MGTAANRLAPTRTIHQFQEYAEKIFRIHRGRGRGHQSKGTSKETGELVDANASLAGVTKAMKILKDFYDNAFIQMGEKYKPRRVMPLATQLAT